MYKIFKEKIKIKNNEPKNIKNQIKITL